MGNLFRDVDWVVTLRRFSVLGAILLLVVSYIGFVYGLDFSGGVVVASCIWAAFTVIQFIGNYSSNWDDWVFFVTWIFTYMVGIGAGTWAAYNWIRIDNTYIHWLCAIGMGGAAELIPERLLSMFVKTMQGKAGPMAKPYKPQVAQTTKPNQPWQNKPKQDWQPQHHPQQNNYRPDPYLPLSGAKKLNSLVNDESEY